MFRHLVLVRHATAEEREWSKDDSARALTEKGHFQAKTLAHLAKMAGIPHPDLIFTSGYRRAEETLRYFYSEDDAPVLRDANFAPDGNVKRALHSILQNQERYELVDGACVLVVGHNPQLEVLLEEVAPRCLPALGSVQKGTLIWLDWEKGGYASGVEPRLRMLLPRAKFKV